MKIKKAYYPTSMPTEIVIEDTAGRYYHTALTPFRKIEESELKPLAFFSPMMGDVMPDYTLKFYGLTVIDHE